METFSNSSCTSIDDRENADAAANESSGSSQIDTVRSRPSSFVSSVNVSVTKCDSSPDRSYSEDNVRHKLIYQSSLRENSLSRESCSKLSASDNDTSVISASSYSISDPSQNKLQQISQSKIVKSKYTANVQCLWYYLYLP